MIIILPKNPKSTENDLNGNKLILIKKAFKILKSKYRYLSKKTLHNTLLYSLDDTVKNVDDIINRAVKLIKQIYTDELLGIFEQVFEQLSKKYPLFKKNNLGDLIQYSYTAEISDDDDNINPVQELIISCERRIFNAKSPR